jgi:flavoprotein
MSRSEPPRIAWALSGSGHYLKECLDVVRTLDHVDLFLSEAAAEVVRMPVREQAQARLRHRVRRRRRAGDVLYDGNYHTVVIAPASSNTVAKCVAGISDTLVTNLRAGGQVPHSSIVFACDTAPALITDAPDWQVWVYTLTIDFENVDLLSSFRDTKVVLSVQDLSSAIDERLQCVSTSCS